MGRGGGGLGGRGIGGKGGSRMKIDCRIQKCCKLNFAKIQ